MKDLSVVLATDKDGIDITIEQVNTWLLDKQKRKLAEFFYDRFYGRYLRPLDYPEEKYKQRYKNGFAIMINCCLLIETFVSWSEPIFRDTTGNGERCFGYFFLTQDRFKEFSNGGLKIVEYTDIASKPKPKLGHVGVPCDFYHNVRCGLLHNGETKNGWKISRKGVFFDENSKRINSVKFMNRLKSVMNDFKNELIHADFDKDAVWLSYKNRLADLINNS